ncbi:MAG: AAA family ATPase, partial [Actinomycetia bacterium]|nr:AAA family ATPase [Actinomycetes bacterium]
MKTIFINEKKGFEQSFLDDLKKKKDLEVTTIASLAEAQEKAGQFSNCILVIGPSCDVEESMLFAETLTQTDPNSGSILVSQKLSTNLLKSALRAGFRDVVEDQREDIMEAVDRVRKVVESIPQSEKDKNVQIENKPGKVFTFFSTKGGVGKTVFSANTAVGLAKQDNKKTILLDLDHHFGDIGVMLGLEPDKTIADLI